MQGDKGGAASRNPFLPRNQKPPSTLDKQAAVFAAEQNLKPWELPQDKSAGKGKQQKPPAAPLNTRYKAAIAAPVNAPVKVGKTKVPSRQYLAQTETPKRRQQYERIITPPVPAPKPDTSFVHALLSTPTSVYQHGIEPILHAAGYTAKQASGQGTYKDRPLLETLGLPAKALAGNALVNAVTHGQTSHLGAAGLEAAAMFPPFKGIKIARDLAKAAEAGRGAKVAEATVAEKAVAPYVSKGVDFRGSVPDEAHQPGFLYHRTSVSGFNKIRAKGLIPAKPVGENPAGVYFGQDPLQARGLSQKQGHNVYVRVHPSNVQGLTEKAFGESFTHKAIPASKVEYLGADGQWHPVAEPLTGKTAAKQIIARQSKETRLIRQQKELRHADATVRAAAVKQALMIPGEEGRIAALEALKGPRPTLKSNSFEHFDPATVDALVAQIRTHPDLQHLPLTMLNTEQALHSVVAGNLPRPFEQKLLRNVFGEDLTNQMIKSVTNWQRVKGAGMNVVGIPRTLETTFDLSAPLRQGLLLGVSHPVMWGKNFPTMLKAFKSPQVLERTSEEIARRPTFDLMRKAGVSFTGIGDAINGREEAFMSSYAEHIPLVGRVVRSSNRAFVAFLNKSRADLFDYLLEQQRILRPDVNIDSEQGQKWLKDYARVVGNATGRGTFKNDTINKALPAINQIFFAPRLLKSRLDVIANPSMYIRLNPVARREAFKQLAGLVGTVSGVLVLAKMAGAKVATNPTNADWAKIRLGNTRFDIAGGFQQPLRLMAQLEQQKIISSTTGKTLNLKPGGGFGHLTMHDILERFVESKFSPPTAIVNDFFKGSDFQGHPFSWKKEAYAKLTPLLAQDAIDLYRSGDHTAGNIAAVTALYGIGMWGVGAQTYGPKQPTSKKSNLPLKSGDTATNYFGTGNSPGTSNSSDNTPNYFSAP